MGNKFGKKNQYDLSGNTAAEGSSVDQSGGSPKKGSKKRESYVGDDNVQVTAVKKTEGEKVC